MQLIALPRASLGGIRSVAPPPLALAPCERFLASLAPFAKQGVNLLKIESRPIHGRPWEYQFFIDVEANDIACLDPALAEVRNATSELRVLGRYVAASR